MPFVGELPDRTDVVVDGLLHRDERLAPRGVLVAAAGYIRASDAPDADVWVSVWVAAKGHNGVGLELMAGCMVATSLAMAPAMIIAQGAEVADLDGPLLLARDRDPGLVFDGSLIFPPTPQLWG